MSTVRSAAIPVFDEIVRVELDAPGLAATLRRIYPRATDGRETDVPVIVARVDRGNAASTERPNGQGSGNRSGEFRAEFRFDPPAPLRELFPPELDARFEWADGLCVDRSAGVRFQETECAVIAEGRPETATEVLLFHYALARLRRRRPETVVLHGAAVVHPHGGAVILVAPSGAGKSTLTTALCRHGWGFFSDEIVALHDGVVFAYPRAIGLRDGAESLRSFEHVSARGETKHLVDPLDLGATEAGAFAPLAATFLLESFGESVELQPTSPTLLASRILPHCYTGRSDPAAHLVRLASTIRSSRGAILRPGSPDDTASRVNEWIETVGT